MVPENAQSQIPPLPADNSSTSAENRAVPLCVDLDGTLIKTDCSWETAICMLRRHPLQFLAILCRCDRGGARIKKEIAKAAEIPAHSLPYNADTISLIQQAKAAGRKALLVTASDQIVADAVAAHLRLFDEAIGSDGVTILRGAAKAKLLVERFGRGGFDYAGDSAMDIPVWEAARHAYAVNPAPAAARWLARRGSTTILGERQGGWRAAARLVWPRH